MKHLRVLHLTQPYMLPPQSLEGYSEQEQQVFKTDFDVVTALRGLGHEVASLGVEDELRPIQEAIREHRPHVVFNLVEAFAGLAELDQHVVSYLELLGVPYTGCNPRGLVLSRGKALSKKLVHYHRIHVPKFNVFPRGRKVRRTGGLELPAIVKSLTEESSQGISQASVVDSDEKFVERVAFIHESVGTDAIAEQYIDGRELYVGVLGNERLTVLPTWELWFENLAPGDVAIATSKAKHDVKYQKRKGVFQGPAEGIDPSVEARIQRTTARIYRILGLDGYARIDYRLDGEGRVWFLEANPNPDIAGNEEFACSAEEAGIPYRKLIQRIVNLGLRRTQGRPIARRGE